MQRNLKLMRIVELLFLVSCIVKICKNNVKTF